MMQPEEGVLGPAADSRLQLEPPADCGLKAPTERAPGCCRRAAQGCSAWARSVQRRCRTGLQEQEDTPASCPAGIFRPQEMLAVTLAVIALICLLMALAAERCASFHSRLVRRTVSRDNLCRSTVRYCSIGRNQPSVCVSLCCDCAHRQMFSCASPCREHHGSFQQLQLCDSL
eukprot:TRINITY_DN14980_c0_g1_i1.p1 TRINITY_DN14980_c0_g1~~TRINITY_DN14980_c0_g1_i1.p1  ORF type:complete len:185 (+),score=18.65 TRINITY_DN14980_c0_g1_i1:37-555(+)